MSPMYPRAHIVGYPLSPPIFGPHGYGQYGAPFLATPYGFAVYGYPFGYPYAAPAVQAPPALPYATSAPPHWYVHGPYGALPVYG